MFSLLLLPAHCCLQACQLAVVTTPRDSHALCLLGLAQLAQYDNNPNADKSKEFITDACLSFKGSIELEDKTQSGEPPEQLSSESVDGISYFAINVSLLFTLHFTLNSYDYILEINSSPT